MSIEKKILQQIESQPTGIIFLPADFADHGTSEAIRLSLFRLVRQGKISRVAQGIYIRPTENRLVGKLMPSAEQVAEAIIKRDKVRTVPSGSYALNALGLTTQVPMNLVLLTDGSPRIIKLGKRKIKFKKTTPKNLLAKGSISRLVIQALKEIGNGKLTESEEKKILELLSNENKQDLQHDLQLAPVWIRKIMIKALDRGKD